MTSISEIARDPRKALKDLEKDLEKEEGTLMRDMQRMADEIGDWTQHIPYTLAAGYYESVTTRERYQPHVDECAYCQQLLESLHPTDLQTTEFTKSAVRAASPGTRSRSTPSGALKIVASVLITFAASLLIVPQLEKTGLLHGHTARPVLTASSIPYPSDLANISFLSEALKQEPNRLVELQLSHEPKERFLAAKYYFAANKPELAYQELGEGLQLAGHPVEAVQVTTVSNLPSDKHAAAVDLTKAVQQLPQLQATAQPGAPSEYLEIAQAQARLGLHDQALISIERYLQAQHVDPKTLADFATVALEKPLTSTLPTDNPRPTLTTLAEADLNR